DWPAVERWPLNEAVWDHYVERLGSADAKQAERAAQVLARSDGLEVTARLFALWRRAPTPRQAKLLEDAIVGRADPGMGRALKDLLRSGEPGKKGIAAKFLRTCLVPALWEARIAPYTTPSDTDDRTKRRIAPWVDQERLCREHTAAIKPLVGPLLPDALAGDPGDRAWGAEMAGRIGAKPLIPKLIAALNDEAPPVRAAAARALGQLGAAEAARTIERLLDSESLDVRVAAAGALGELGARQALPKLRSLLGSDSLRLATEAARAAARMQDRQSAAAILALLEAHGPEAPEWPMLVGAAVELKLREAVPRLVAVAGGGHGLACPEIEALGRLGDAATVKALETIVHSKASANRRRAALVTIGRLGGPEARRACRRIVDAGATTLLAAAAEGLARCGDRLGCDLLIALLGDGHSRDHSVSRIRRTLVELTGKDFGPGEQPVRPTPGWWHDYRRSVVRWTNWWQANREGFGREPND
ncbi:MAG TPA: HEAT repeat domain-containing protein, partial [Armatimonadota bacterium]|nr:HEAT repeat domain-containing protein [Armatimonadota bacterium]